MFRNPITLSEIAKLSDPRERVSIADTTLLRVGVNYIQDGNFRGHRVLPDSRNSLKLNLIYVSSTESLTVKVQENGPGGNLNFQCDKCQTTGGSGPSCKHQWASYYLLWQALTKDTASLESLGRKVQELAAELKKSAVAADVKAPELQDVTIPEDAKLESVSLFLENFPHGKNALLASLFNSNVAKYQYHELAENRELLAPSLWNMPEVFRRRLKSYSGHYLHEVNELNRLSDMLRYNFSHGLQVSAREILRHPLQKIVPKELLPQRRSADEATLVRWPLALQKAGVFISQNIRDLEEIMQSLMSVVIRNLEQGKIQVYLQAGHDPEKALQIREIQMDPAMELHWRVDFDDRSDGLEGEFKIIGTQKNDFIFFENFAVQPEAGVLVPYSWENERQVVDNYVRGLYNHDHVGDTFPEIASTLRLTNEFEITSLLKYLRSRSIPVVVEGGVQVLNARDSLSEIHLDEKGGFFVQHRADVRGEYSVSRKGWTLATQKYLKTLSLGIPFYLDTDARNVASRMGRKKDWDLKLLRHLGVLQYLFVEILSYHFDGHLTDQRVVTPEGLFPALHERIQNLLVSGTGELLSRDKSLEELCSRSVLVCFENFVTKTLEALKGGESFYSERGELIVEGLVEKDFRLLYEILKRMALVTGGEIYKKSRTTLLSKIWTGNLDIDPQMQRGDFVFPKEDKDSTGIRESLEVLQLLVPHGFKIYYKGQVLQELGDDDFRVDFEIFSEGPKDFNWFELNPRFFLRGVEINPHEVGNFGQGGVIEYDGRLYLVPQKQMPSLRRLEGFWQRLQKGQVAKSLKKKWEEKIYKLPRHQVLELLALRSSGYAIRGDDDWKKLCEFYDQLGSGAPAESLPKSVKASLKPYQSSGVQWLRDLYRLKLGALLADDMGLGKTLQALCFLEDLRVKQKLGSVLIVVPSSLVYNWQSEVEKFTPELPLAVFTNKDRDAIGKRLESKEDLVVVSTYGLLMEHETFLNQYNWNVLVFDEAQNLKNITTKRTSSARTLNAQFKICLTGTPMENHYGEFYSLVDILVPGSLGKIEDFRRQFVNTEIVSREQLTDLKLKIKPLLLRRTKKEILDQLPEKQETKVSIAFEEKQKRIYRDIALSYNHTVQESMKDKGEASVQLQMLTALLRLRQACSDPGALPQVKYDKTPPKLEALLDSAQEIVESGESALVFTQFLQTLEHTERLLKERGIPVFVLHGGVPTKQRQKLLSDFNKLDGGAVLIMTLKTGGVGLNLTKASYVFHIEPWWNPSVENQATDRAHRLGQSKAVQVFRYIMHESLEEKIELLKDRKDKKFQTLFANSEKESELGPGSGALTKEDFDLLLGIKN
ncbi:DEAD/DEAH box helicase [Bdellovibrio sp. HCB2-146]|uniref:DEAD/DEAH box helicase n=1 Tax=Bdellovibrio sp. HCB2-146 TaxID=3394362 RepID=UPI0039BCFFA7